MEKLNIVLAFSSAYLLLSFLRSVHGTTITSCSQTPYPETCNHFINTNLPPSTLDELAEFKFHDLVHKVTMHQAMEARRLISAMDTSLFNDQAKSAWNDCSELYEDTVNQLNRSTGSDNPTDAVTWISASIANQQTCHNGFTELGMSSNYLQSFPNMLSNFSKLLSNVLAVNKEAAAVSSIKQIGGRQRRLLSSDSFPTWVSAADRKLLQSTAAAPKADVVVAKDGSGNYQTISEAVAASGGGGGSRFIIYVKAGVYKENVVIKKSNIMIVGDGIDATIVTGNKNVEGGSTTFRSATFAISESGDQFIARDITFENTAGPQNHQAVALRSGADFSVFYRCSFKGYQDTLYVYSQRQFYRDCDIYGTQDFIFGDAVAVLQNCNIYVRKPLSGQKNTITAQARTDPNENTGIVIHNCRVTAAGDLRPVQNSIETYLGRPWQEYSRTVFMKSNLDSLINPAGWLPWSGTFALKTLYYGEYMNTGSGAGTSGRINWPGYHVITSPEEAGKFTVGNFLAGGSWIPKSGVPFVNGI